jgi:hypothetical protein
MTSDRFRWPLAAAAHSLRVLRSCVSRTHEAQIRGYLLSGVAFGKKWPGLFGGGGLEGHVASILLPPRSVVEANVSRSKK